jgi:type I restriction enzyme, S subunit
MMVTAKFDWRPLGELCEVTGGNSAPQGAEYFKDGTMPFVRMRDLGGYHHTTCLDTTRDAVSPATIEKMRLKIFEPGCIVFPRSGSVALNHRAILGVRACIVSHIGILRQFHKDIDVRWLYWFLVRYDMSVIAKQTTGLDLVGFSDIKKISVPVASLPEQRRIVAEIEKQFSRLEEGVGALRRVQANLKRYRAAVLKAACEGQLVPTEAERQRAEGRGTRGGGKYETGEELLARILAERRKNWQGRGKYKEPAGPDTSRLGKLPAGWAWAIVDQITENHDGRRVPLKSADRDMRPGQYPYYGASGVIDDIDDYLFDGEYLLIAEDGANLLSRSTPIAFKATGKFWVNNHAHIVQTCGGIPLAYLSIYLNGKDLAFSITGSAQPKLTQAALNKIPVPLPPFAEQSRIVAEVERRLSVVEEMEATVKANLQRATRLRQSILQKSFGGKLV